MIHKHPFNLLACEGILSNHIESNIVEHKETGTYHYFNYNSEGFLNDIRNLLKDIKYLEYLNGQNERSSYIQKTDMRRSRLDNLKEKIKMLISENKSLVLLGLSHGGILMQIAIFEMYLENDKIDNIYLVTIGCPYCSNNCPCPIENYYDKNDRYLGNAFVNIILPKCSNHPFNKNQNQIIPERIDYFIKTPLYEKEKNNHANPFVIFYKEIENEITNINYNSRAVVHKEIVLDFHCIYNLFIKNPK